MGGTQGILGTLTVAEGLTVFLLALAWGLVLYRLIRRLALSKSILWPLWAYCDRCWQPFGWVRGVPVIGYLVCRGRCRRCGQRGSWNEVVVPVVTAGLLFTLYRNYLGGSGPWYFPFYPLPFNEPRLIALFWYHAILLSLLMVATFIDLEWMIIPDAVTVPGMLLGVLLGTFWYVELHPVPLFSPPTGPAELVLITESWWNRWLGSFLELTPAWRALIETVNGHWVMNWNRWLGLSTGLVGLVVGGGIVWIVRAICTFAFRKEAMGFGDVTLMAMIGAFVGWQTAVIAFFLAPVSAVVVGILGWIVTGRGELPYGPHLSIATIFCVFCWRPLWSHFYFMFAAEFSLLFAAGFAMLVMLFLIAMMVQWMKRLVTRVGRRAPRSA